MKNRVFQLIKCSAIVLLLTAGAGNTYAQCPMCRMSAESNLKNGGTDGRGLNAGILYMLALPYLTAAGIGFWWWRNRKSEQETRTETFSEEDFASYN